MAKAKARAAKTPSERSAESRAAKIAAGYAQKNWLLAPAALDDLERIIEREDCTETEAVERALAAFAKPGREPSNRELAAMVARRLRVAGGG